MKIENTYHRPIPSEKSEEKHITAVLTKDCQNQFAVYIGLGSDEWVGYHGVKLNYKEAIAYFPMLLKEDYRR